MLNKVLTTPVDNLVELIKNNQNCTINFLKSSLKIPYDVVEKWLIILEEYKVIEIHYKGFEGFVKYVKLEEEDKEEKINIYNLKEIFLKKSQIRNLSSKALTQLWPKFIATYEPDIKVIFYEEARKRNFEEKVIPHAWTKYKEELMIL